MIPGVVEASGGKVLASMSDNFNRSDNTDITAVGAKWTETSGSWSISSNRLSTSTSASSYPIATLRTNTKNATLKVEGTGGDGWGVAFWVVDHNNWWSAATEMTQSSVQNPATSGSYQTQVFAGNTCGGRSYNGDASWPPYGGTCYDNVCISSTGGTPASYYCPGGYYESGTWCVGACVYYNYPTYPAPHEQHCPGGATCCAAKAYDPGTPGTCNAYQAQNCCIHPNTNDPGCPGNCNGQASPTPTYTTGTVYYNNPETRTWTYSQRAIIRRAVAGTVSTIVTSTAVASSENTTASGAAGSPTRPTSLTVTLNGESISVSAPGAAGGTITASHTATGANRGKKHGVTINPASVSQASSIDNFVYTKPA